MSRTEMMLAPSSVPNADPSYYKDATELASLIRAKQLSSREVVQAHLDRIQNINPKVNAIVTLLAEDALKSADAADHAVKNGEALGPLHGVPFTIKDAIDTAGVLTQRGSPMAGDRSMMLSTSRCASRKVRFAESSEAADPRQRTPTMALPTPTAHGRQGLTRHTCM